MKNICDWNNCNEIGDYKAPVEKDNSKKFRMLCLEHVKEFNKNWNYFSGMNDDQVMDFLNSFTCSKQSILYFLLLSFSTGALYSPISLQLFQSQMFFMIYNIIYGYK